MARVLIVGCGCRGRSLGKALQDVGHQVRGTTRDPASVVEIEAVGIESYVGDPYRLTSLLDALAGVTVVCWLMGSATGISEAVVGLHGSRLRTLLERVVDSGVRGLVYEACGSVDQTLLVGGRAELEHAHATWRIPYATVDVEPQRWDDWLVAALAAVDEVLAA